MIRILSLAFAWSLSAFTVREIAAAKSTASPSYATTQAPLLFPQISLSRTQLVFAHAGDIWIVSRGGGTARRLTSGAEDDSNPSISPDGSKVAFSRAVGNDADVYVVPVTGGLPSRLSFNPFAELVRGWTPDGTGILFTAIRMARFPPRLYTVPASGGPIQELPIPAAWNAVFNPDGRIVYASQDVVREYYATSWRGYRGGSMAVLALADLRAGTFRELSDHTGNDRLPTWAGNRLLIASDRSGGIANVFSLDVGTGQASQITRFTDRGIGALSGSPDGTAAYERDGRIFLLDPSNGKSREVPITLTPDRSELATREVSANDYVYTAAINSDDQVAVATRGDILLLDSTGHARNLTASSSATDAVPAFSPDGRQLAFISFGAGGDTLVLESVTQSQVRKSISLPAGRGGYVNPQFDAPSWSPDGEHLTLTDARSGLWLVNVKTGTSRLIAQGTHMHDLSYVVAWSPNGEWIAYDRHLANNNRALFLYHVASDSTYQLTGGEIDAGVPAFSTDGTKLYFVTSGNAAIAEAFGTYPVLLRPLILRRIHVAELDFSKPASALREFLNPAAFAKRVVALPLEQADYESIASLTDGSLIALIRQWPAVPGSGDATFSLFHVTATSTEPALVASNVDAWWISADRRRLLVASGDTWTVHPLPSGTIGRTFTLQDVKLTVNPAEEWRQIYREAWRSMRDNFYDPAHHGQDVVRLEKHFAAYLPGITRRADLTALLYLALGNVSVSHIAVDGGDNPPPASRPPSSGLLGADFKIEDGHFRFSRVYSGPGYADDSIIAGPLQHLDPPVVAGQYLLRINGVEARTDRDLQTYLLSTAGKPTTLTIAERPDSTVTRDVTVRPLASDAELRKAAWAEDNRATVLAKTNGTVGYVYIPDYNPKPGLARLIREWTAASDKDGVVLDQRYAPGGVSVDFFIDLFRRKPLAYYAFRDAHDLPFPVISNKGPRVMIVNERNGSAADTAPWFFKKERLGLLVGQRTAGTGIGHIWRTPLLDGGEVQLPLRAFFNPAGTWDSENSGVEPDIKVDMDPAAALRGEDSQLNAAIDAVLKLRRENPTPLPRHPAPLVYPPQPKE